MHIYGRRSSRGPGNQQHALDVEDFGCGNETSICAGEEVYGGLQTLSPDTGCHNGVQSGYVRKEAHSRARRVREYLNAGETLGNVVLYELQGSTNEEDLAMRNGVMPGTSPLGFGEKMVEIITHSY